MTEQEVEITEATDKQLFDYIDKTDPEILANFRTEITDEEKENFINSDLTQNPVITYPNLEKNTETLQRKSSILIKDAPFVIESFISTRNLTTDERYELEDYYSDFIKRRQLQYNLLQASNEKDYQTFNKTAEKLYGNPSIEIFNTYLKELYTKLDKNQNNQEMQEVLTQLREILPKSQEPTLDNKSINLTPFREYLKPKMKNVEQSLSEYSQTDTLDSNIIKQTFEIALKDINAEGYQISISDDPKLKSITVRNEKKEVLIPQSRQLKKDELLGLVAHEIFTHVQRRVSSEDYLPYEILRTGLNGYLDAEEAIATFGESVFSSEKNIDLTGGDLHFGTCLALGLDGKKRDFKDVYKILYLTKKFNNLTKKKDLESSDKDAKEKAFNTTTRIFRGTDGTVPGVCFRKDITYGEGRLQLYKYLQNNNIDIKDLYKAKYAPWNKEHTNIIKKYNQQ